MSVDGFIRRTASEVIRTDVLHLSPPCQYFSPAHTIPGTEDDANIFAQFGGFDLIQKVRPRLITLEQTFGVAFERHQQYFRAILGDFTYLGYSVRWKVVRLCTWGLAQDRRRLILIAAGPGEALPPFPESTHAQYAAGNLKAFTTIRQAIGRIKEGDDLHDLTATKSFNPTLPRLDFDGLSNTITCGNTNDYYYPDGSRSYTLRELASLQGFPLSHRFRGTQTSIRRQIGNAFPSNVVKCLYKHLHSWLLSQDGMAEYRNADNVVLLDDTEQALTDITASRPVIRAEERDHCTVTSRASRSYRIGNYRDQSWK